MLAGVGLVMVLLWIQTILMKGWDRMQAKISKANDERTRILNEIFNSIKLIKMYAWEKPFSSIVSRAWAEEESANRKLIAISASGWTLSINSIRLIGFVTYVTFVTIGDGHLDTETLFVTGAVFNLLSYSLTMVLPNTLANLTDVRLALNRIQVCPKNHGQYEYNYIFLYVQEILDLEEKQPDDDIDQKSNLRSETVVKFDSYSAKWDKLDEKPFLKDVNLELNQNELTLVIGSVGSGKSCLLNAILRELAPIDGQLVVKGQLSYSPQESWCFSATVRDNILLGSEL